MSEQLETAQVMDLLRLNTTKAAIDLLSLPPGSRGLDAGCGAGAQAQMLAESIGPGGHVTGLDLDPSTIATAANLAENRGIAERLSFVTGDVHRLPFADNTFDWVWSMDCVGYMPADPVPLIAELARVTRPGGTVAILAWTHEALLPGYPAFEARLGATKAGIAPFQPGSPPETHFLTALGWFCDAGLAHTAVHAMADTLHAPLSGDEMDGLRRLFRMRWSGVEPELSGDDLAEFRRLCFPDSPDFIVRRSDYCALFTYTMFHGVVQ